MAGLLAVDEPGPRTEARAECARSIIGRNEAPDQAFGQSVNR